ncbi:MAG: hypothetical protein B7Z12_00495 [Caulobacter vibrioides]|jgi:hypothetical protein|uniref:Uncharacterized protein n=1 Tax=Caulobacter vibrioides TaxID=155892 RepID=A0A258DFD9_CAUVI|nr:MAG: hypothetical protein B7Z12_00495 [Caulobacter vibrioides]
MSKSDDYETELVQLQLALIALQKKAIKDGDKILKGVAKPDSEVIFPFEVSALEDGRLAR